MRPPLPLLAALLAIPAFAFAAAAQPQAQPKGATNAPAEPAIVAEARAFMEAYGRDLLAANRAGIARRYDRRGAWFLGNGNKTLQTYAQVEAHYAGRWAPPKSFEWRGLEYEPLGPNAVVVVGTFLWGRQDGSAPRAISYTGLLIRQEGELRIRVEDESGAPPPRQ